VTTGRGSRGAPDAWAFDPASRARQDSWTFRTPGISGRAPPG
jgi:hypothetical protein